jgi:hypothetical protein
VENILASGLGFTSDHGTQCNHWWAPCEVWIFTVGLTWICSRLDRGYMVGLSKKRKELEMIKSYLIENYLKHIGVFGWLNISMGHLNLFCFFLMISIESYWVAALNLFSVCFCVFSVLFGIWSRKIENENISQNRI